MAEHTHAIHPSLLRSLPCRLHNKRAGLDAPWRGARGRVAKRQVLVEEVPKAVMISVQELRAPPAVLLCWLPSRSLLLSASCSA